MMAGLRRHPFAVEAFFRHSLVLTFAYPEALLQSLLPPCLRVDSFEGCGFLAIALVETRAMRPAGWPEGLGRDFFLSGYRIFSRYRRRDGRELRGLHILRSYTDRRAMVWAGNLFTRYRYRHCLVERGHGEGTLAYRISTPSAEADLTVSAQVGPAATAPPAGSPFPDLRSARRFAGPLPFTFSYEAADRRMVIVQGVRRHWEPKPVVVALDTLRPTFLAAPPFAGAPLRLANAFLVESVPYRWQRGESETVPETGP